MNFKVESNRPAGTYKQIPKTGLFFAFKIVPYPVGGTGYQFKVVLNGNELDQHERNAVFHDGHGNRVEYGFTLNRARLHFYLRPEISGLLEISVEGEGISELYAYDILPVGATGNDKQKLIEQIESAVAELKALIGIVS